MGQNNTYRLQERIANLTVANIEWCWQKPSQLVLFTLMVQRQIEILLKIDIRSVGGERDDDRPGLA